MILPKDRTAQKTVQLACGILRVFQAVFWFWTFFTSQTLSTPAHKQLTQTVETVEKVQKCGKT
jgi:hypothetical protein